MDLNAWMENVTNLATQAGMKVAGALVLWIVGRWLARMAVRLVMHALSGRGIDETLIGYLRSSLSATLNVVLVVAILGFFGVETTSFAALLAAVGVAIGMAWSGLLANFAAGIFLVLLRPFHAGDFITAGGVTGTVKEIGLFVTVIDTLDNVRTVVGNNKIFSDNIRNFTANPYRRVDLVAQLNHSTDPRKAISVLRQRIEQIPNVSTTPRPDIEVLEFNLAGPVLAVRPYCHNDDYWQVYFDTNMAIREAFGEAAFPAPEQHVVLRETRAAAA